GLIGGKCFLSANRCSPDSFVNRVLSFLGIELNAMSLQIGDFLFTAQLKVAYGGNDFHGWNQDIKNHIKTDLIVSGTGAAMGNVIGAYLPGIAGDGRCLKNTFCADR